MFEIRGRYATARCYLPDGDSQVGAVTAQVMAMLGQPFAEGQSVAIMPDAHPGAGCVVGTTMTVGDKVVPAVTGSDLGCGVLVAEVGDAPVDFARLDAACHDAASGRGAQVDMSAAPPRLRCTREVGEEDAIRSLGTLGGGNHFIEVDRGADGLLLLVHSGSRLVGQRVARHYQALADRSLDGGGVPRGLRWLEGEAMRDYLHDAAAAQAWARLSREAIALAVCRAMGWEPWGMSHTTHNYIDVDRMILRKGAISALPGERVVIPLNMRDGAFLAVGRGNPEWNMSAPHGAGRRLSRGQAKGEIRLDDYRRQMAGIHTSSVSESTIDEAPDAYKPEDALFDAIGETVDVTDVIRPEYNYKSH